jgi:hypothetical protein
MLDVAESDVAAEAEQAAHAGPARPLAVRAAAVVVIDEDGLARGERPAAHSAGVALDLQQEGERSSVSP